MKLEISPSEIIYRFDLKLNQLKDRIAVNVPEYKNVFKKIKTAIEIDKEGYNVFLIDEFSKDKLEALMDYARTLFVNRGRPRDICYVTCEDRKAPKIVFLSNGKGNSLKEWVKSLQDVYAEKILKFYNNSNSKEKEEILQEIQKKRNELISSLMEMAKNEEFDVKPTHTGFSFIPLKSGEAMTEKDYEELEINVKEEIIKKVSVLKHSAQDILEELKKIEQGSVERIKGIFRQYLSSELMEKKGEFEKEFAEEKSAVEYLRAVCCGIEEEVTDVYTTSYDDDEEKISEIVHKYVVNVIVDNSSNSVPQVIFEEDPNVINLLGSIEYENRNGNYVTDVSLIKSGSILKANEGCLIIRVSSLFSNPAAYYYLKKTLISGKVKFDYNRGYLELLSLGGLKPEPVDINLKLILIGDHETFDLLFAYDEDFRKLFRIRAEFNPVIDNNDESRQSLINAIIKLVNTNKLNPLTDEAIKEMAKYLSRKANDKRKLFFNNEELGRILFLADNKSKGEGRVQIESRDVIETVYSQELIEKEILEYYKDNKIILTTEDVKVGSVNGLAVIDAGYLSFGKPIRITCTCYKGQGNIIDVQKESNLSGSIHSKAVNILLGYLNGILGGYNRIPVDFHLSFEQVYGKIDGDSASVAEVISMISTLSKIPVKQYIAVTGSINQFGEVQPIGGVNEKIEGFFNVCKLKGGIKGKGVLVPYANREDIILNSEVENAINAGDFHIYSMTTVEEAVTVLMADDKNSTEDIFNAMYRELKKYGSKKQERS